MLTSAETGEKRLGLVDHLKKCMLTRTSLSTRRNSRAQLARLLRLRYIDTRTLILTATSQAVS